MRYASANPSDDPDVLLYHVCKTFGCLPSQLDAEDAAVMERLAYIDYVATSKQNADAKSKGA